ncbi:hypothetical protein CPB84DRAFT_1846871 [Gymnopilus junonius]|uniref:DUF6535 domain-containing protein n=1 Tax=Gymnopilus junonius TaxID=109634 RepID=A0A9P5TP83_GYMJU|nr:hypothetical protein CPB84DRAFT_1846871 [Gymnopilus junonius]
MRAHSLEQWYVPQVFATLPLLLQAALVLFFAGLIDFLIQLAPSVAIPVAVAVGLTVIFLLITTVSSSLHCISGSLRQSLSNSRVPSQCPYKLTQSLTFRRLITLSRPVFSTIHELFIYLLYIFVAKLSEASSRFLNGPTRNAQDTWKHRFFSHRAYLFWASPHWIEFDRTWLILRNEHLDITRKRVDWTKPSQTPLMDPIYDSIRALSMAVKDNEYHENVIFAAYHCFQDVSLSAKDEGEYPNDHLQACYRDLVLTWNSPIANIASIVVNPSVGLLHDIHTVLFLRLPGIFYKAINPSHIFGKRMLELHTRILGELFGLEPRTLTEEIQSGPTGFFHWYTINMTSLHSDPEMKDAFCEQFFMIFDSFIKTVISHSDTLDVLNTFHTNSDLGDFISLVAYLTWRTTQKSAEQKNADDRSLSLLVSILSLLQTTLTHFLDRKPSSTSDYFFCCISLYLKRVWQERPAIAQRNDLDSPHFTKLGMLLKDFQYNVLPRHEHRLDQPDFFRLYGKFISKRSLPQSFFRDGRDFAKWYTASIQDDIFLTEVKDTFVDSVDKDQIIVGDIDWTPECSFFPSRRQRAEIHAA